MKKYLYVGSLLLVIIGACRSRQEAATHTPDSTTTVTTPATDVASTPLTSRLVGLGLTTDSHWRGITIGDNFSRVGATEKSKPFEQDAQHVGYTVEFPNLESMDVLYYRENGRVSAIAVDLFLNSRESVQAYEQELDPYFTARYGTPKGSNTGAVWTGKTGETITLSQIAKGKDVGLKIKITPAGATTTASVQ